MSTVSSLILTGLAVMEAWRSYGWAVAALVLGAVGLGVWFYRRAPPREWVARRVRTAPGLSNVERGVLELKRRNEVLGSVANMNRWTQELLHLAEVDREEFFAKLNNSLFRLGVFDRGVTDTVCRGRCFRGVG